MSNHEEFPTMTPAARAVFEAAVSAIKNTNATISSNDFRRALAAFQREAIRQADPCPNLEVIDRLIAITTSLHSPPPPPPTLAQARAADLSTPAGRDVVRDFLATLGEAGQT